MKRVLAHRIIYLGREYGKSVATIDGNEVVDIKPFETETASTVFISGTIMLVPRKTDVQIIRFS